MTIQQLKYFIELAHTHNYTLAAQRLFITQPTLSYSINQMEKELGVQLFFKNGRSNVLTEAGERFLSYAEGAMRTIDAGVKDLHAGIQGRTTIRIGFLRYLGIRYIPQLISGFKRKHPDIDIEWSFETGSTALLLDGMNAGQFDLVFCAPFRDLWDGIVRVSRQRLYLAVPNDHELLKKEKVTIEDAAQYPFIYYARGSSLRNIISYYLKEEEKLLNVRHEVIEEQIVAGFVAEGFGIGIVPVIDSLATLPVSLIDVASPKMERDIFMIPTQNREISPVLELFMKYVKKHPLIEETIPNVKIYGAD